MEKINIAELLKDCPKGMELDCAMYKGLEFDSIVDNDYLPICCRIKNPDGGYNAYNFTKYGGWLDTTFAKCVIFPKGKTTWKGFQRPFKDGDIVTWEDRGSLVAFIYKERKDVAVVKHHFALYKGSLGTVTDGEISLVENEIVFATEEEKQKLFDAIKANGYKWNAETKILEKLIKPKFKVGDRVKKKDSNEDVVLITDIADNYYIVETKYGMEVTISMSIQNSYELVPNKFDINTLKPFDKVLVRDCNKDKWNIDFFGYYRDDGTYQCMTFTKNQCIPYEVNKELLGTTNNPKGYGSE